jgi:hypothetical protein
MIVGVGGYIVRLARKINIAECWNFRMRGRISGGNRSVSQDRADACGDFRYVLVDVRLVSDDGIPIDKEELLLRPAPAKNIDQHTAELTCRKVGLLRRHLGVGRKIGRGERA